jgi:FKBP-type peptidyl-prolyl cis-trans isomerase
MINRPFTRPLPLLAASVSSLLLLTTVSCTKDEAETATPAVEPVDPAPVAEVATPVSTENDAAYQAMGFAMASQLRLNIGFTDAELDQIFAGMKIAAKGGEEPENFQQAVQQAQTIYMGKMQAAQAEEQKKAAALAEENKAKAAGFFASLDGKKGIQKTESGLYYEVIEEGAGESPAVTDRVKVNYRGTLTDGREFDANDGAEFMVSRVVPGFSEGLQLMKEGGKLKLYIPAELGYGDSPARPGSIIQPGSTLVFDLELIEVTAVPPPPTSPPPGLPANMKPPTGAPTSAPTKPMGTPPPPPDYTPPPPPSEIPPPPPGVQ